MTAGDKFQRHPFRLTFKLKVKSVRDRLFNISNLWKKELMAQAHMRTSTLEPEPEPEPPKSFTRSRSRSRSRNTSPEPEPEPEPTKNVTAPYPCWELMSSDALIEKPLQYYFLKKILVDTAYVAICKGKFIFVTKERNSQNKCIQISWLNGPFHYNISFV